MFSWRLFYLAQSCCVISVTRISADKRVLPLSSLWSTSYFLSLILERDPQKFVKNRHYIVKNLLRYIFIKFKPHQSYIYCTWMGFQAFFPPPVQLFFPFKLWYQLLQEYKMHSDHMLTDRQHASAALALGCCSFLLLWYSCHYSCSSLRSCCEKHNEGDVFTLHCVSQPGRFSSTACNAV